MEDPEESKEPVSYTCETCQCDWESIGRPTCCPFCGNVKIIPTSSVNYNFGES